MQDSISISYDPADPISCLNAVFKIKERINDLFLDIQRCIDMIEEINKEKFDLQLERIEKIEILLENLPRKGSC